FRSPKPPINDDEVYGTIDNTDDSKPNVSGTFFNGNVNVLNQNDNTKKKTFGFNFGKNKNVQVPNRELPRIPKKAFNRNNIPSIDDAVNPTYESIDAENDSMTDPFYSRVDDNPNRSNGFTSYRNKNPTRAVKREEPLYTSASQIYSGGSEDPYSSIVSDLPGPSTSRRQQNDDDGSSSYYASGYAKIKDPVPSSSLRKAVDIDQLYAKINRPSIRKATNQVGAIKDVQQPNSNAFGRRPMTVSFAQDQLNESGSGSIVSGTSTNPSYRYLTVRETVDVVRERIRQRQANLNENDLTEPVREHYYSTIANEYESVGGSLNGSIYGGTIPIVNAANRTISPLTLNVARLSGIYEDTPPRPPTSPIPNRLINESLTSTTTIQRPTDLMSTSLTTRSYITPTMIENRSTSNPNLSRPIILNRLSPINLPNLWQSNNLYPRGQPRIIPSITTINNLTKTQEI
uniref:Uncharacterized protein n=1 Tax=Panagrolaimus sp. JU765 TaxID=591449 RepID=A0AC34Q735_9BILA